MTNLLFDYLNRLQDCESITTAWQQISRFAGSLDMPRIACAYGPLRHGKMQDAPFVRGTFKPSIGKRWSSDNLYLGDPLVERALASPVPFCWGSEYLPRDTPEDIRFFYETLRDDGARSLFVVPLRCDQKRGLGVGMVGNGMPRKAFETHLDTHGASLALAVIYADLRMVALSRAQKADEASLAPRETQCLQLLTSGLKNDEIASRMGITVHTVQLHLASAKRKLGATTREQALAKALTFRLIRA